MIHISHPRPDSINLPDYANDGLLRRIRGEFLEMPGLRLTEAQAARLWGIDLPVCSELLRALIDTRFLFRTRDGAVMRVDPGTPLKAGLSPSTKRITAA
jgi:hypothetical protein